MTQIILPGGVEYGGEVHRDVEIGPRKVRHLMAATKDPAYLTDNGTYELCCIAAQIERIGSIPKEAINGALILDMLEEDFNALMEAAIKARQRAGEFRPDNEKARVGHDEDGISVQ